MSDSNHAVLSLNVIGRLTPGDSNEMPIMLPGVDVELREVRGTGAAAGATARPITGTTDANGTASGLAVTKGRSYSLVVRLGDFARFPGIHPVSHRRRRRDKPVRRSEHGADRAQLGAGIGSHQPAGRSGNHPAARQERFPQPVEHARRSGTAYHLEPVGQWIRRPVHRTRRPGPQILSRRQRPGDARAARLHRHPGAAVDSAPPMAVVPIGAPEPSTIEGGITVGMRRTTSRLTEDVPLWVSIRKGTIALASIATSTS